MSQLLTAFWQLALDWSASSGIRLLMGMIVVQWLDPPLYWYQPDHWRWSCDPGSDSPNMMVLEVPSMMLAGNWIFAPTRLNRPRMSLVLGELPWSGLVG